MSDCIKCIHYPVCSNFQKYMFKTGAKYCGEYFNLDKHDAEIRADERRKFAEWYAQRKDFSKEWADRYIEIYEKEQK